MLCHATPLAITHIIDQVHLYSSLICTLSLMAALKITTVGGIKDIACGSIKVWRSRSTNRDAEERGIVMVLCQAP
ncbi:hypothetical protein CsSME_00016342 [Camellia sinensis var. sinensis]